MAEAAPVPWRFVRTFSPRELSRHLEALERERSLAAGDGAADASLEHHYSQAVIARDAPGLPRARGAFERACELSARYAFSDPRIVIGHFDSHRPLLGRPLLLELRVMGLRILVGVRVGAVHTQADAGGVSVFAWRYDTLPGHVEFGSEWFRVLSHHASGEVLFQIEARWRPGEFPNWWTRAAFPWLVHRYQRAWHRRAHERMRRLLGSESLPALPPRRDILHAGMAPAASEIRGVLSSVAVPPSLCEPTQTPSQEPL